MQPLILFIPSSKEFEVYRQTARWVSGPLAAEVAAAEMSVVNVLDQIQGPRLGSASSPGIGPRLGIGPGGDEAALARHTLATLPRR